MACFLFHVNNIAVMVLVK